MSKPSLMTRAVGCLRDYRERFVAGFVCRCSTADGRHVPDDESHRTRKAERAQLAALPVRMDPHFLNNTLATVQYLVRRDVGAADFLLSQLIRYLRDAVSGQHQPLSTLQQEFETADACLQIARMRMGGRLAVTLDLPEHLREQPFPPTVLRALVDTVLEHSVEPKLGRVAVLVRARREATERALPGRLVVEVVDDGVGLVRGNALGAAAGLCTVRGLLAEAFGDRALLSVVEAPANVTIAGMIIAETAP